MPGIAGIVGVGACTAVGRGAAASAAAVRAAVAAMAAHPYMIDRAGDPMMVCACPALAIETPAIDRFVAMALSAAGEAMQFSRRLRSDRAKVTVIIALPDDRPGKPQSLADGLSSRIAAGLSPGMRIEDVQCISRGHAAGVQCLEYALAKIERDPDRLCLVGGVDSYIDCDALEWLDHDERLHSRKTTWGFCPGEAAGFCLLASSELAQALDTPAMLDVVCAASDVEAVPFGAEGVCVGDGLSKAFRKTLAGFDVESQIDQTICDMNGEPYRVDEYGFSVLRTARRFASDAECLTPADSWGDVGAASGPLFAILAAIAARKRYAPGPRTLVYASSDNGLRSAAALRDVRH